MSKQNKSTSKATAVQSVARITTFVSPNGKEFKATNLAAFAKRFNLDGSSLSKVINGARSHYKNWTVKQVS